MGHYLPWTGESGPAKGLRMPRTSDFMALKACIILHAYGEVPGVSAGGFKLGIKNTKKYPFHETIIITTGYYFLFYHRSFAPARILHTSHGW
jgi:hypothetical protein